MTEEKIEDVKQWSDAERKRFAEETHNSPAVQRKVAEATETLRKYPIDFAKLRSKS